MANKRSSNSKKKGFSRERIWKIWGSVGSQGWFDLAQEFSRDSKFSYAGKDILKGICPRKEHADTTPSFYLNAGKGFARCYGCDFFTSNPLNMASLLLEKTEDECLHILQERFNLTFITTKDIEDLEAQRLNQQTKQVIQRATHAALCEAVYDTSFTKYPTGRAAVEWLLTDRKIPIDAIPSLPIGLMPPLTELVTRISQDYLTAHRAWIAAGKATKEPRNLSDHVGVYLTAIHTQPIFNGSVVFPMHVTPNDIGRFKLRAPHSQAHKDIIIPKDPYEENLGVYGMGWSPYQSIGDPTHPTEWVYLTEGEFDVLTYMAQSLQQGGPKFILYSVGGTSSSKGIEPILTAVGYKGAYLIGDAPYKGSQNSGDVLKDWIKHTSKLRSKVFVGWDELVPSNDLDEAVLTHGIAKIEDTLWKNPDDTFEPTWKWVAQNALEELQGVPEDDRRLIMEKATRHGQLLRNKTDIQSFVDEIGAAYNVKTSHLKREIASSEDTEMGFILRCTDALQDMVFVVGTEVGAGGRWLIFCEKETKAFHRVRLDSEQSIAQEIAPMCGTLLSFIDDKVGFPSFLENPADSENLIYSKVDTQLRFYMKEAFHNLALGSPNFDSAQHLRQGYHHIESADKTTKEYIVCGTDVFRIEREGASCEFVALEGPSDQGIVFDVGFEGELTPSWYPGGLSVDILNQGKSLNINALYDTIHDFLDTGFQFKNHNVTVEMLTALLLSFPIHTALPRQLLMFFTGDTSSGKTHLVSVFSGFSGEKIQLLLCARGIDQYTPAGVFAMTHRDSRLLALDEFESTDPEKRERVETILQGFRGLVTGETARVKARPDGSYSVSTHKLPVIFSAISSAAKPQDLNRLLTVEMDRVKNRDKPTTLLHKKYGQSKIDKLAKDIAIAMYSRVPEFLQCYSDIEHEFSTYQATLPFQVPNRFATSLFGALAMMKMLGRDWKAFFRTYVILHESALHRASTTTESESFLKAMMFNPALRQMGTDSAASVAQLLANKERRTEINTSACGVFYDEKENLLLILLEQAIPRLMPYNHRARNISST